MCLPKGSYVTSNSEIQHLSPPWLQVQGGVHPIDTESGRWNSDGTGGVMSGPSPPEARDTEAKGPGRWGRLR